jgi:enterochelin esterase-like enzyme
MIRRQRPASPQARPPARGRRVRRVVLGAVALAVVIAGTAGVYSYGSAYYQHRGFATIVQLPRAGTGRLERVHFFSTALHRTADYMVYLPPGYSRSQRYPVYYLLHGMPGRPQVWVDIANMDVRLDNQLSEGHLPPMILVYPDGRIGGSTYSDSEWANTPSGHFEDYVLEVVRNVDHRFATLPDRQDRVIAGFSAGAYGAINIALHNLGTFGSVQVWSGYFVQTRSGAFARATHAELASNSPLDYVARVRRQMVADPLRVCMFVGRDDESSRQLLPMVRALRDSGATVHYAVYSGGHDWSVWYPRLNAMLIMASRDMGRSPHAASAPRQARKRRAAVAPRPGHRRRARGHRRSWVRWELTHVHALFAFVPPRPATRAPARHHHEPLLVLALLLALISAAAINLGFVLEHRGLARLRERGADGVAAALRSPVWLAGQAVGWVGFLGQILAVAIAPLSLVQAFAAGGLALSVPIAAGLFGYRVQRLQVLSVLGIAACLFSLPLGFSGAHGPLRSGALIGLSLLAMLAGLALGFAPRAGARAIAAGIFYGVADAAIKAESTGLSAHGVGALASGWTILAIVSTFAGFLAFQTALRDAHAVNAIALMNAFAALAALALALSAFGESLGSSPAASLVHAVAIALVLTCVAPLARAQQRLAGERAPDLVRAPRPGGGSAGRPAVTAMLRVLRLAAVGAAVALGVLASMLVGTGLLYGLRGLHSFALGPRVADSLPLLQLAGFDGQPLVRVAAAWLLAGAVFGLLLIRVRPLPRACLVAALGLVLLLFASDASYALARNDPLSQVLWNRAPGTGPWLEALLVAAGSALPRLHHLPWRHSLARALTTRTVPPGRPA